MLFKIYYYILRVNFLTKRVVFTFLHIGKYWVDGTIFFFINVWNWGLNTGPHAAVSWKDNASALCMFILNSQEAVQSGLHLTVGGLEFVTLWPPISWKETDIFPKVWWCLVVWTHHLAKNVDTFYNVDNDSIMMYEQPSPWDDWMT